MPSVPSFLKAKNLCLKAGMAFSYVIICQLRKNCHEVKMAYYTYQFITVTLFGEGNGIPHEIAIFTQI